MRVLVIGHTYMTRFAQAKYEALTRLYPDVSVTGLVPRRLEKEIIDRVAEERWDDRLRFIALPTALPGWGSRYFFTSPRVVSILREFHPDVVQIEHEPVALVLLQLNAVFAALRQSPKTVLFSWEDIAARRNPVLHVIARSIERLNVPRLAYAIAGNDDAVGILRSKGYRGPITLLPQFGIDPDVFRPGEEPALRRRLGLGGSFVIGFAGRIVREKGLLTLTRALLDMPERDWKLLLVGRGDLMPQIEGMFASAGLGDSLRHIDSVPFPELPQYYRCMDAFVLPSETTPHWKEQFGHVLPEAMSCGVPVIASSSGFIPRVVGDAGLIFPEGDEAALGRSLARVMDEPGLRGELVEKGHRCIAERYSHEALARQIYKIYSEVTHG
jgi:glycosyltransferase involved in cell wall biosynthesis